jgi:hypothetical protein
MAEHTCDKGPLIERMITQLDDLAGKIDSLVESHGKIEQSILGNGLPGIADHVGEHAKRLDEVEATMLTHDIARKLLWKVGGMTVGAVGLTATVIGIVQAVV